MTAPQFTLAVVATLDGFIARSTDDPPNSWASEEEQTLFMAEVERADWSILGRHTHLAADKPDRRRIILSSTATAQDWRRPRQLWLNPTGYVPSDLAELVSEIHPLNTGLILGGTRVHDWFYRHNAIDRIKLTVEPIRFGAGIPMFSDQPPGDPRDVLRSMGFAV
ncbi:MAG: dihydrofolate reductase family protein, partial [Pseudomonadota bacterium]